MTIKGTHYKGVVVEVFRADEGNFFLVRRVGNLLADKTPYPEEKLFRVREVSA